MCPYAWLVHKVDLHVLVKYAWGLSKFAASECTPLLYGYSNIAITYSPVTKGLSMSNFLLLAQMFSDRIMSLWYGCYGFYIRLFSLTSSIRASTAESDTFGHDFDDLASILKLSLYSSCGVLQWHQLLGHRKPGKQACYEISPPPDVSILYTCVGCMCSWSEIYANLRHQITRWSDCCVKFFHGQRTAYAEKIQTLGDTPTELTWSENFSRLCTTHTHL